MPAHPVARQSSPRALVLAASPFFSPVRSFFWLLDVWVRAGGRDQTRKKQPKVIQTLEHNSFHRPRTLSLCRVSRGSAQANADSLTKVMRNRRGLLMRPIPVRPLTNEGARKGWACHSASCACFAVAPASFRRWGLPLSALSRFLLLQTPPSARTDPQALRRAVFLDRAFFF